MDEPARGINKVVFPTRRASDGRGFSPGIFVIGGVGTMKDLSIFVDESGDPGTESKYYLIALVFHDQSDGFERYEADYLQALRTKGLRDIPLHLSPLLNGNDRYRGMDVEERKRYLAAFRVFLQYLPFTYAVFAYKKSELDVDLLAPRGAIQRIRRDLAIYLLDHLEYLQQFDEVKIYYDNGQSLVTETLHDAVEFALSKEAIIYRDASPQRYRLSQVADYICTLELEAIKYANSETGGTDQLFFGMRKRFEKDFLKKLRKHRL